MRVCYFSKSQNKTTSARRECRSRGETQRQSLFEAVNRKRGSLREARKISHLIISQGTVSLLQKMLNNMKNSVLNLLYSVSCETFRHKAPSFSAESLSSLEILQFITSMLNVQEGTYLPKYPQFASRDLTTQNQRVSRALGIERQNFDQEQDDEFEPEYHTMKKLRLPINRSRLRRGNWSVRENKIYLDFLIANRDCFVSEAVRRQNRVFCRLSELLKKKRTPDQCRSHHQKLIAPLDYCLDLLILKLERKINTAEQILKTSDHKPISEIGKAGTSEKLGSRIKNEKGTKGGMPVCIAQGKQNDREVSHSFIQNFFRMTFFKNSSVILIEINSKDILSY